MNRAESSMDITHMGKYIPKMKTKSLESDSSFQRLHLSLVHPGLTFFTVLVRSRRNKLSINWTGFSSQSKGGHGPTSLTFFFCVPSLFRYWKQPVSSKGCIEKPGAFLLGFELPTLHGKSLHSLLYSASQDQIIKLIPTLLMGLLTSPKCLTILQGLGYSRTLKVTLGENSQEKGVGNHVHQIISVPIGYTSKFLNTTSKG